jgi:hypothetical protein
MKILLAQRLPSCSDGTLITQRFHFASESHTHRHVLGWYRLAQELNNNGVHAVCIFDGKERSPAKAQEVSTKDPCPFCQRLTAMVRTREGVEFVA